MPSQYARAAAARFLHITFGIWLGVYAFRAFVPTAVWNLSDTLPLALKGALAIGIHAAGAVGCFLPVTRRKTSIVTLAIVIAVTTVLRQAFIGDDIIGSTLSLAGWVFWLWWLAALARRISTTDGPVAVAAFATALSLQVGMQAAWHGLDLPMARGISATVCAAIISALFAATAMAHAAGRTETEAKGTSRVFIAFGVGLFLELTLLANVGRAGAITHLDLLPSTLLVQGGLILGLLLAAVGPARVMIYVAAVGLLLGALVASRLEGAGGGILVLAQAAVVILTLASSAHKQKSSTRSFLIGVVALFALVFAFYNWYELPILWLVAAIVLALCALPIRRVAHIPLSYVAPAAAGVVLALFAAIGSPQQRDRAPHGEGASLLTYNIHQGFDAYGVPAMQSIADEIASHDADIIALQEVGRGWTFVGGADLIAYLRYRFPDYRLNFAPVNGQLWGVALMSRLPTDSLAGNAFASPPHAFRYGFAAATVRIGTTAVRVVSVHLTAGLEGNGGDARIDQADQLLRAVTAHANVIIAGDLNAHPDEPPVQRIIGGGYRDGGAAVGLGSIATWPASAPNERIDYVFTKGVLHVVAGSIKRTNASDHLPVIVRIAIRNP